MTREELDYKIQEGESYLITGGLDNVAALLYHGAAKTV